MKYRPIFKLISLLSESGEHL